MRAQFTHHGHAFMVHCEDWEPQRIRGGVAAGFLIAWLQTLDQAQTTALHRALLAEDQSASLYHRAIQAAEMAAREARKFRFQHKTPPVVGSCALLAA